MTLIELMIVVVFVAVIAGLGLFVSMDFYRNYALSAERDTVVAALRKARLQAAANVSSSAHGVFIGGGGYTIFYGPSYASRSAAYDETIAAAPGVAASGLNETVFSPLAATSTASGTITLGDGVRTLGVTVNYEGRISW